MNKESKLFHVEHQTEEIKHCPICLSGSKSKHMEVVDYGNTGERFGLERCASCGFVFTSPRPVQDVVGRYYEFEDYISHTNGKKGLFNRLYQAARSYALLKKLQLVLKVSKKKGVILDYGCGTGEFLGVCKKAGWEVKGVEPSNSAREQAIKNYGLDVVTPDNLNTEKKFQVITLWHVLEHLPDLNETFNMFNNVLTNDGALIIAVPNPTSYDAEKYKEHWAAYDVPRHFYHFRPEDIKALSKKHGFKVIDIKPMLMDAFYISLLSEKYKYGKTSYLKAILTGIKSNLIGLKHKTRYSSQIYVLKKQNKAI